PGGPISYGLRTKRRSPASQADGAARVTLSEQSELRRPGGSSAPLGSQVNAKTIKCIVFLCVAGMIGGVSYIKIRHDREIERIRVTCVNNLKWIAGAKDICAQ